MKKQTVLKIINPLALVLFIIQALTGITHELIPFELFEKLHGTTGYLLVIVVMTHILFNWNWFKTAFRKH